MRRCDDSRVGARGGVDGIYSRYIHLDRSVAVVVVVVVVVVVEALVASLCGKIPFPNVFYPFFWSVFKGLLHLYV